MYIIEMHTKTHAHAQIILEKGDTATECALHVKQVIINHAGDVDLRYCKWCLINRKEERRNNEVG